MFEETRSCYRFHGKEGVDCFIDKKDAEINATMRARKKILSLQKQIKKLEPLMSVAKFAKDEG